jgi:ElaA protein
MRLINKYFQELTVNELHALYALRCKVFVVEQNCPYQEVDEKDTKAYHVMGFEGSELVACARILSPGVSYQEPSIGRVAVDFRQRGTEKGKQLMQYVLMEIKRLFPNQDTVISAQEYLLNFYRQLGFVAEGDVYLEDNIPHVQMRRLAKPMSSQ